MKRTLSLLLAAMLLLGLLVGCASEPAETPSTDAPAASITPDTPVTDEPAEEPAEAPADEPAEAPAEEPTEPTDEPAVEAPATMGADVAIPFAEPKTFTFWLNSMGLPTGYSDYNECEVFQELEVRTNAHIDWTVPSAANSGEQFSLMLTSGEYTDVFCSPALTGGYDYSIEEEIIIDLSELVPVYAPLYWEKMNSDETTRKDLYTDAGNLPGINLINVSYEANFLGYYVRQDWLDKVGFTDTMETFDDWTQVMQLWKDQLGITGALYLDSAMGSTANYVSFMAGFDTAMTFLVFDDVVQFAPAEQNFHDYLELMHSWYAADYIDPDFTSAGGFFADGAKFTGEQYGLFDMFYSTVDFTIMGGRGSNPDYALTPIDYPRLNDGDMQRTKMIGNAVNLLGGSKTCISTQCEEPEAVLQWFDYLFTDEGYMLANYGIEGETYNIVDGEVVYTEYYTNNPDGISFTDMGRRYNIQSFMACYYDWDRSNYNLSPEAKAGPAIWDARWDPAQSVSIPQGVALTTEESEATTSRRNDINTLVEEYVLKIILGDLELESTWDGFVEDMYSMGLEDCIAAYQAAYDRYQAR